MTVIAIVFQPVTPDLFRGHLTLRVMLSVAKHPVTSRMIFDWILQPSGLQDDSCVLHRQSPRPVTPDLFRGHLYLHRVMLNTCDVTPATVPGSPYASRHAERSEASR